MAENPLLYSHLTVLSSLEAELLQIEHGGNREFHVFLRKIVQNIETHFPRVIDCSSLYATRVTCCCFTPNRWAWSIRSRDKDGGHTIRSAMAENPLLHANLMVLSSIVSKLLPIEILHGGNSEFLVIL